MRGINLLQIQAGKWKGCVALRDRIFPRTSRRRSYVNARWQNDKNETVKHSPKNELPLSPPTLNRPSAPSSSSSFISSANAKKKTHLVTKRTPWSCRRNVSACQGIPLTFDLRLPLVSVGFTFAHLLYTRLHLGLFASIFMFAMFLFHLSAMFLFVFHLVAVSTATPELPGAVYS